MNKLERQMVQLLKVMKDENHVLAVKAEFEAEGTRTEELMRLKEISNAAGVHLALKIGGCDACRDMLDARFVGVNHMVAPMVESAFALRKYVGAINRAFPQEERQRIEFFVNLETIETLEELDLMLDLAAREKLAGFVLGRGDLVESMGLPRTAVDDEAILAMASKILVQCKERGFTTVMGGGIGTRSIEFLRRLPAGCLDRFETRKVCFRFQAVEDPAKAGQCIERALEFEYLWLTSKRNFYLMISDEDQKRLQILQQRFQPSN